MESKMVVYNWAIVYELPDGSAHRLDGPAYFSKISNDIFWCINGFICNEIHQWAEEFNIDLTNLTDEDKQMIALYWGDYRHPYLDF